MKQSLWGAVQQESKFQRGVTFVSTARHGGFMISKGFAVKNLSSAAQKRGIEFGGYLCYEEDCLASIILLELPNTRNNSTYEELVESISYWNADYLLETGITPEPKAYAKFLADKEDTRRRNEKCPNLIVSAMSMSDSVVKVHTADGKAHFVTAISYDARLTRANNNLSDCEIVPDFVQTTNLHY